VGLREGDIVETVDGHPATRPAMVLTGWEGKHTLGVVRANQRLEVVVQLDIVKEP
jgi:hypothetical protein